jgi:uncharacterized protein YbjT (DUF2867 family)
MPSQRMFVTGGTGYLGSRLIPLLLERGHHVTALTRPQSASHVAHGAQAAIGNPLDAASVAEHLRSGNTIVQLVGVPKPAPWKGAQFRAVDRLSGLASIEAAKTAGVSHFVYVSVAHPAPIMQDYIAVRRECEDRLCASGLPASIVRPWYILGPGHWWPLALQPVYRLMERVSATKKSALRLGLVTIQQMLHVLVWAVEHPPDRVRIIEVPEIRRLAMDVS